MQTPETATTLTLKIHSVERLFDDDGSPLIGTGIHPDAAQALRAEALRHKPGTAFRIAVTAPAGDLAREAEVQTAIRNHFTQEAEDVRYELAEIYRDARQSLGIGLVLAVLLLVFSDLLFEWKAQHLAESVARALIVLSWVALWHPAEAFLYTPLPVRRRLRIAQSLSRARVALQASPDLP